MLLWDVSGYVVEMTCPISVEGDRSLMEALLLTSLFQQYSRLCYEVKYVWLANTRIF